MGKIIKKMEIVREDKPKVEAKAPAQEESSMINTC